jgi:acyl-CoA synthetase (NDP forming)
VPELSPALLERIRELLQPYASAANPVDLTPAWSLFATAYPALIELPARSGEVDAVSRCCCSERPPTRRLGGGAGRGPPP